jgi:hypothetical protein
MGAVGGSLQLSETSELQVASGFLQRPCESDENHRTNEGHYNRADDSPARPILNIPNTQPATTAAEDNVINLKTQTVASL